MKKLLIALAVAALIGPSAAVAGETAVMTSTAGSVPEGAISAAAAPAKVKKLKKQKKPRKKAKKAGRHRTEPVRMFP